MAGSDVTVECLLHAVADAQGTIRAYDTKAEVLGILLTLAVGITNFTLLQETLGPLSQALLVVSWVIGLIAIVFLGLVLHPKSKLFKDIKYGNYSPTGAYFLAGVTASPETTIASLAERAASTDWVSELTFENMKLSLIREHKDGVFKTALRLSGVTVVLTTLSIAASWFNV